MNFLKLIVFSLGLPTGLPLYAENSPVVVELFTSQGCASCPPADALLMDLATRENVIALAQHVDYWDYIGWKDIFAQPAFSERQRSYARVGGREMIYTPQMIVNGVEAVVGARSEEVTTLIRESQTQAKLVDIETSREGSELSLQATLLKGDVSGPLVVQIVQFTPRETVEISRGENAGRNLKYANVVKDWTILEQWHDQAPYKAKVAIDPNQSTAVLIQYPGPGKIIGAVLVD